LTQEEFTAGYVN